MSEAKGFFAGLFRSWMFYILYVTRQLIDKGLDMLYETFYRCLRPRATLSRPKRGVLSFSATKLARKIRTRQLTAEVVVSAYVDRIREVDPLINCVAEERFNQALSEARAADGEIRQLDAELAAEVDGDQAWALSTRLKGTRPLLGVPFVAHETIAARGMRVTGGLRRRKNRLSDRDAAVIDALRDAGAILVATTAGAEAGAWWESSSALHGTVLLPHDLHRTAGGPGGGAAALLAAAGCPLAVGADAGGGMRTPAAFCGLFCHAASPEIVSSEGVGLEPEEENAQAVGPMSRHVEDMKTTTRIMARGPVALSRLVEVFPISKLRVFYAFPPPLLSLGFTRRQVRMALNKAVEVLRGRGASVDRLTLPEVADAAAMFRARVADERPGWSLATVLAAGGRPVSIIRDLIAWPFGRSELTLPTLLQCIMLRPKEKDLLEKDLLRKRLTDLLDMDGVLLYPVHPTTAPFVLQSYTRPMNILPALLFSALGVPACVVPCGKSKSGLPLAVQVVAAPGMDHLCMMAAETLWECGGHAEPKWAKGPESDKTPERELIDPDEV